MSLYKAEAVVLRSRNLGEADKIVTLFTYERGKVDAVAKGVRRPRSRLLGVTQLFTHGRYMLYERKSLDTISQGEIVRSFLPLREDLYRMAHASYMAELIDQTTELNDRHPQLFPLLLMTMEMLATGQQLALTTRYFELQLMQQLGFRPHLADCVRCGAGSATSFSIELGGLLCDRCRGSDPAAVRLDSESLEVMRYLSRAEPRGCPCCGLLSRRCESWKTCCRNFARSRIGRWLHSMDFLLSLSAVETQGVER